jgi:hypothetical protein
MAELVPHFPSSPCNVLQQLVVKQKTELCFQGYYQRVEIPFYKFLFEFEMCKIVPEFTRSEIL